MSRNVLSITAVVFAVLLGFLTGCSGGNSGNPQASGYSLSVTIQPAYTGAVTPVSGTSFTAGSTITLATNPAPGYTFSHWSGPNAGDIIQASSALLMNENKSLIAVFTADTTSGMHLNKIPNTGEVVSLGGVSGHQVYLNSSVMNGLEGTVTSQTPTVQVSVSATTLSNPLILPSACSSSPSVRQTSTISADHHWQIAVDSAMRAQEQQIARSGMRSIVRSSTRTAITVGTQLTFYIDYSTATNKNRATTCEKVGTHCYIFVDNDNLSDSFLTATVINEIAAYFDNTAYPIDTSTFGSATDTDGDPRLYIVCSPLQRNAGSYVAGFFSPIDKYTKTQGSQSNAHDMFYLTVPKSASELADIYGTLAHEFQHMINFDIRRKNNLSPETAWLNEGLSELATFLCTGGDDAKTELYLSGHACSLTVWDYNNLNGDVLMNYAGSRLFLIYLYDRFKLGNGQTQLLQQLENSQLYGIENVAATTGCSFDDLFQDWVTALLLSNSSVATDAKYQYQSINLHQNGLTGLQAQSWSVATPNTRTANLLPYVPRVWTVSGFTANTGISLSGQNASGLLITLPSN